MNPFACSLLLVEVKVESAALYHKALDNSVEDKSREESRLNKVEKVLDGYGSLFGVELCHDLTVILDRKFDLWMIHR